MKRFLLGTVFFSLLFAGVSVQAQSLKIVRSIVATGTIEEDGVTLPASSDDAEQENDEIDSLFDDDIDAGWEGEPGDFNILTAGMRFQNLAIPQGARIDSAFIYVTSHEGKTADDVARLTITADANDNAPTFTEDSLITARSRTAASVLWEVAEEWGLWEEYRTVDISTIIQEKVNSEGWQSGNPIAFIFQGEDQGPADVENAREWESMENLADPEDGGDGQNHPERIPRLEVYYSVSSASINVPIVATGTIEEDGVTLPASSDDAEQENDEIDSLFDDDIDAGWEGEPGDFNILTAGMRFQNLMLPQNAVIDSAFIYVTSHEGKTADDVARITITADANVNAPTFTEDSLITDRARTAASVLWEVAEEWGLWEEYRTSDISSVIQEKVNSEGWEAGNAIAFIFQGEDQGPADVENAREWESMENLADPEDGGDGQNHPERIPRLVVYYSSVSMVTSVNNLTPNVKALTVYPNPATDMITIELEDATPADIRLFNMNGQLISRYRSNNQNVTVNLANLPQGTYVLNAVQGQQVFVQKVIKK